MEQMHATNGAAATPAPQLQQAASAPPPTPQTASAASAQPPVVTSSGPFDAPPARDIASAFPNQPPALAEQSPTTDAKPATPVETHSLSVAEREMNSRCTWTYRVEDDAETVATIAYRFGRESAWPALARANQFSDSQPAPLHRGALVCIDFGDDR